MSYDFAVYTVPGLDADGLRRLVIADPGLTVADGDEDRGDGQGVAVGRRTARGDVPAFEVRGPFAVEPYDVPPDATGVALGLGAVYAVGVPGASSGGVRAAEEFCRRLADAAGGVVLDRQLGDDGEVVWPPEPRRGYAAPDSDVVDVVRVDWLVRSAAEPAELPDWWLDLTLRLLPEARPVGFGPTGPTGHTGPFTGRLDRDGDAAFRRAWEGAPRLLGWSSRLPLLDGELTGGGAVRRLSVTVLRDALDDPRWRQAVLTLLTATAEVSGAFYAQAQVLRGWAWDARGATPGLTGERADDLAPGGEWLGLPPEPVWCAWFGEPYAELVRDHLPADATTSVGPGLLYVAAEAPVDRGQVAAARPRLTWWQRLAARLGLAHRGWLPSELCAARPVDWWAGPDTAWSGPLRPARVRPPGLALTHEEPAEPTGPTGGLETSGAVRPARGVEASEGPERVGAVEAAPAPPAVTPRAATPQQSPASGAVLRAVPPATAQEPSGQARRSRPQAC